MEVYNHFPLCKICGKRNWAVNYNPCLEIDTDISPFLIYCKSCQPIQVYLNNETGRAAYECTHAWKDESPGSSRCTKCHTEAIWTVPKEGDNEFPYGVKLSEYKEHVNLPPCATCNNIRWIVHDFGKIDNNSYFEWKTGPSCVPICYICNVNGKVSQLSSNYHDIVNRHQHKFREEEDKSQPIKGGQCVICGLNFKLASKIERSKALKNLLLFIPLLSPEERLRISYQLINDGIDPPSPKFFKVLNPHHVPYNIESQDDSDESTASPSKKRKQDSREETLQQQTTPNNTAPLEETLHDATPELPMKLVVSLNNGTCAKEHDKSVSCDKCCSYGKPIYVGCNHPDGCMNSCPKPSYVCKNCNQIMNIDPMSL